jgi:hypothetical protein
MKTPAKTSRKQPTAAPATGQARAPVSSKDMAARELARKIADRYVTKDGKLLQSVVSVALVAVLVAGCAAQSAPIYTPSGEPGYRIACNFGNWGQCFQRVLPTCRRALRGSRIRHPRSKRGTARRLRLRTWRLRRQHEQHSNDGD